MRLTVTRIFLLGLACFTLFPLGNQLFGQTTTVPMSKGVDFWMAFPHNTSGNSAMQIKITADANTSGNISSPLGLNQNFTVGPTTPYTYTVPTSHIVSTNQLVENKGIHITGNDSITVYASTIALGGGDAIFVPATPSLGTEYRNMTYRNLNATTMLIIGTQNGTTVNITPRVATQGGNGANTTFSITLNQGQTYMVKANGDLSGTRVSSNRPVQTFGHSRCSQVPSGASYCDCIWGWNLPVNSWGTSYVTGALAGRNNTDRIRIMANTNGTVIQINGTTVSTINAGAFYETTRNGGTWITTNNPVSVTQYAQSKFSVGGSQGDPAMIQLIPASNFLRHYRFATLAQTSTNNHYLTIVAPSSTTGSVTLNGAGVGGTWNAIGTSGYSYNQRTISTGSYSLDGPAGLMGILHGFNSVNSYGTIIGGNSSVTVLSDNRLNLNGEMIQGKGPQLTWFPTSPQEEIGTYYLDRSNNTADWKEVNTQTHEIDKENYLYLDETAEAGETWFYRVRMRDQDGTFHMSNIVSVNTLSSRFALSVWPNPFAEQAKMYYYLPEAGKISLTVRDATGKTTWKTAMDSEAGEQNIDLAPAFRDAASGIYFLEFTHNDQRETLKLIHKAAR